jgi:hypothetical protein
MARPPAIINVTDVVYHSGGITITFDDDSIGETQAFVETIGGRRILVYRGLSTKQAEAWGRFNRNNISTEATETDTRIGATPTQITVIEGEVQEAVEEASVPTVDYGDTWDNEGETIIALGLVTIDGVATSIMCEMPNGLARVSVKDVIRKVQGGYPPFTFGISRDGGDTWSESTDPDQAKVAFTCDDIINGVSQTFECRVKVTDSIGQVRYNYLAIRVDDAPEQDCCEGGD